MRTLRQATACLLLTIAAGCEPSVEVIEVMSHDACRGLSSGVTEIDFDQMVALRGLEVLDTSDPDEPLDARLVVVAVGTQFDRGYYLRLTEQRVSEENGIVLELTLEPPPAGTKPPALLPGEEPRPCLVVAMANRRLPVTARLEQRVIGMLPPSGQ